MTTKEIQETTKCFVRCWGERRPAYADAKGVVRVYDSVAGHFTICHSLTPAQERYVRSKSK